MNNIGVVIIGKDIYIGVVKDDGTLLKQFHVVATDNKLATIVKAVTKSIQQIKAKSVRFFSIGIGFRNVVDENDAIINDPQEVIKALEKNVTGKVINAKMLINIEALGQWQLKKHTIHSLMYMNFDNKVNFSLINNGVIITNNGDYFDPSQNQSDELKASWQEVLNNFSNDGIVNYLTTNKVFSQDLKTTYSLVKTNDDVKKVFNDLEAMLVDFLTQMMNLYNTGSLVLGGTNVDQIPEFFNNVLKLTYNNTKHLKYEPVLMLATDLIIQDLKAAAYI